jgi:hypothetical protein
MAGQAVKFGTMAVGSQSAITSRLLSARQRAAGLLSQELRDCERDAAQGRGLPTTPAVSWEVERIREAIAVLCQPRPPERMSTDELMHARDAQRDFATMGATLHGERSHGEAWNVGG